MGELKIKKVGWLFEQKALLVLGARALNVHFYKSDRVSRKVISIE